MALRFPYGLGWTPDIPDFRDYTFRDRAILKKLLRLKKYSRPSDSLREFFPTEVANQRESNLCTVYACLGLVEYFQRRCIGQELQVSPLFLHQMSRRLAGLQGDTGVGIRTTLKALRRFGVPPEKLWPFQSDPASPEPVDPALFAFADDFKAITYFRLDFPQAVIGAGNSAESTGKARYFEVTLRNVKSFLQAGFPVVFGFSVPDSAATVEKIESRGAGMMVGGQAVIAIGYDDHNLLIRNSWGRGWGDNGYGKLPFSFVLEGYACDFWTMIRPAWLTDDLRRPVVATRA